MATKNKKQTVSQDFVDTRESGKKYAQNMIDYIDPATGEIVSQTRGIIPAVGSRFVPLRSYNPGKQVGRPINEERKIGGLQAAYDEAMARASYKNLMDYQIRNIAAQNATTSASAGLVDSLIAARNAANMQNQFQNYAHGVNNLIPIQPQPTMGTMQNIPSQSQIPFQAKPQQNAANINQAMQTYQNLFNQGMANYQSAMQQPPSFATSGTAQIQKKSSTPSFQTPRQFG